MRLGRWRQSMREAFGRGGQVPQPRFVLAFVPCRWAEDLGKLVEVLISELRWPKFAPVVGVLSNSTSLTMCTAFAGPGSAGKARAPRVFFLGKEELDRVSVLSLNPELRNTNTMKVNGTVLASGTARARRTWGTCCSLATWRPASAW